MATMSPVQSRYSGCSARPSQTALPRYPMTKSARKSPVVASKSVMAVEYTRSTSAPSRWLCLKKAVSIP